MAYCTAPVAASTPGRAGALLWVHVFRYLPLTLLVPGQVSSEVPFDVATTIAYGDLVSGLLALVALAALKLRFAAALPLVWLFSVVGIGDVFLATAKGVGAQLYTYPLGWNWYILNFYVPMLIVSHIMIVHRLLTTRRSANPV